jgi:putative transposase
MAQLLFRNRFRIPSARRPGWDFRWAGAYAVTICVRGRVGCLGEVAAGRVALSSYGEIAGAEWRRIPVIHPGVTFG